MGPHLTPRDPPFLVLVYVWQVSAQDDRLVQDLSESIGELMYPARNAAGYILPEEPERPTTVVAITHNTTFLKHFTHAIMSA